MTRAQCLAWVYAVHRFRPGPARRALARAAALLEEGRRPGAHFEAALNDADGLKRVKIVRVVDRGGVAAAGAPEAVSRRLGLRRLLALLNRDFRCRFDGALLERGLDAVAAAGVRDWCPTVSVECVPARGVFPEISLYSETEPETAARALALAAGAAAPPPGRLHACGLDLMSDGGVRLKLYAPADEPRSLTRGLPELSGGRCLRLTRRVLRGRITAGPAKFYLAVDGPRREDWTLARLARDGRGRLRRLATLVPEPRRGQSLSWAGASAGRIEVYLGAVPPSVEELSCRP